MNRPFLVVLVTLFVCWHAFDVASHWPTALRVGGGADFVSYHRAVLSAAEGENPYDVSTLRRSGERGVHPFFYPPPFVAVMSWVRAMNETRAYRLWFWLDELFALLSVGVLWRWWRPLGPALPVVLFAALASVTAVCNNHVMGQFNLPVLAVTLSGLAVASRPGLKSGGFGGALIGLACMLKMSPALFVLLWVVQRRWIPVAAACGTALALTCLSLVLVDGSTQLDFYLRVLPGFSSGDYNGLTVPIDLFGNHSVPNFMVELFPGAGLSGTARIASMGASVGILGSLLVGFRKSANDIWTVSAQSASVMVAMLLLPVYTYEHHLIWAIPAAVVTLVAVFEGRLGRAWWPLIGVAWVALAYDLAEIKRLAHFVGLDSALGIALRELKFGALLVFFFSTLRLGARR